MIRRTCIALAMIACLRLAPAQITARPGDVLGPHYVSGRGCPACHTAHSASRADGPNAAVELGPRVPALWGEDVTSLYASVVRAGDPQAPAENSSATSPDVAGLLSCLGCHDGNTASKAMMQNSVYERMPPSDGSFKGIPTFYGLEQLGLPGYLSEHPVGLTTKIGCGGPDDWDCKSGEGVVVMRGAKSSQFVANYGFFMKPGNYNNTPVVVCTTCHDPHVMNVVVVNSATRSGLPRGDYSTAFFLRAPYNPGDPNPDTNQSAQFCRQCHAGLSNEMNGSSARTTF